MCLLKTLWDIRRNEDIRSVKDSERYKYYTDLFSECILPASYLNLSLEYKIVKLLAQARLNRLFLFHEKKKYEFLNDKCVLCGSEDELVMKHIIMDCPILNTLSHTNTNLCWNTLLNWNSKDECVKFYGYLNSRLAIWRNKTQQIP